MATTKQQQNKKTFLVSYENKDGDTSYWYSHAATPELAVLDVMSDGATPTEEVCVYEISAEHTFDMKLMPVVRKAA